MRPGASHPDIRVAVIVPCLNEAASIAEVVADFRCALPQADIYVIDNRSTDDTARIAAAAGAIVKTCMMRGKGHAVRHAFTVIDADVYLLADGDGTYDATRAPELIDTLLEGDLEMVVGTRREVSDDAYRPGHRFGNRLFNTMVAWSFGRQFSDIFSGYRAFSRRFVKSFPALSHGFDIETEMSVHALQLNMPTAEIATDYRERDAGSVSKLNTYRDGLRILWRIVLLFKYLRPLAMFGSVGVLAMTLSFALGLPVVFEFIHTGLVDRLPTALLAVSMGIIALLSLATGFILDSIAMAQRENKRLFYLAAKS